MTTAPAPLRSRMTIRFRLALALAAGLTPILALGALQTFTAFERDADARRQSLVLAAERSAASAQARVQGAVALLETLTPQAVGLDCTARLSALLDRVQGYEMLARFDRLGRVRCAAGAVPTEADRRDQDWFRQLAAGRPLVITRAADQARPSVLAGVRVENAAGVFDGAMVVSIPLTMLRPDLADPTLPAGAQVALADSAGRLLLQTEAGDFAAPPAGWVERARGAGAALYDGRDRSGRLRAFAGAPLVDRNMFVILSEPLESVWSWARLNPIASIGLPLLAWLAAWLVVWFVTDRVVIRWLAYLDRIAGLYARGQFSVRAVKAASAPEEIRALAHTLDTMADAIVARDESLNESLAQKDALMREIHHRVKNNLQVITSLLNMQQRALTDPAARAAMHDTRQRITALALIYRALYQSSDLRRVDVRQFLEELMAQLVAGEGGRPSPVRTELDADELEIDPDKLAPLALFAVEAITSARKHAFGPHGGLIRVAFRVSAHEVQLEIGDDGVGDPTAPPEAAVGRTLMSAFARQLRGRVEIEDSPDSGVVVRLCFPKPEWPAPAPAPVGSVANLGNSAPA